MSFSHDQEVYILSAVRTPIGTLNGGLSSLPAHSLGAITIREGLKRASIKPEDVSEVCMGQVLTAGMYVCVVLLVSYRPNHLCKNLSGCGQNPARQASMEAGVPKEVPSTSINMLCGSGLKAVAMGFQAIRSRDAKLVVAGGQESMSQVRGY